MKGCVERTAKLKIALTVENNGKNITHIHIANSALHHKTSHASNMRRAIAVARVRRVVSRLLSIY